MANMATFHAFGPGYDPAFLEALDGEALARTGFKPHAGCRHVHSCVDATHDLLKSGRPDLDAITSIEVDTYLEAITPEFRVNYEPHRSRASRLQPAGHRFRHLDPRQLVPRRHRNL